ncbi:hypothetical protein NON20_25570 (plasmid) [Synechocystis sp. B12]|nr:hypothetical protein NON20_25570 [Synechocystis sp. B12]
MKMITTLIVLLTLSPIVWGEGIEPASAQASCQATVDAVAREIRKKGTTVSIHLFMESSWREKRGQDYLGNVKRVNAVEFYLNIRDEYIQPESIVASNILNSNVLMKSYANRIFTNCAGTGYVGFGMYRTSWGEDFGMTDDGILTYYKCSENSAEILNKISGLSGPGMDGYCAYVVPNF